MLNNLILSDIVEVSGSIDPSSLRGKTVFITGASGLVGTYFLAYFAYLNTIGYQINIYAQSFTSTTEYMQQLIDKGEIFHILIDLSDESQFSKFVDADVIIHCAGYAQPSLFMKNPVATLTINAAATFALFKKLRKGGSFMFISSSELYCGLEEVPFKESQIGNTTPYHPRASYIEGKRCAEAICAAYRTVGVRAISIRLGDTYGPGTKIGDKRALNSFIERAIKLKKIELMDQGDAIRTYCYIADAFEVMTKILTVGKEGVYNVGGTSIISIANLAREIGKISGAEVIFPDINQKIPGAPSILNVDLSKSRIEFDKLHYLDLNEGIKRTFKWQSLLYDF